MFINKNCVVYKNIFNVRIDSNISRYIIVPMLEQSNMKLPLSL